MSHIVKLSALEKALTVMAYLGDRGEARLIEVSRDLGMPRATAFRTLATLERHGYVTHRRERRTFALGPTIAELARGIEAVSLVESASAAMADLSQQTGETVNLAILRGGLLVYAAILEGAHPLRMSGETGQVVPFHATALGKAVLSALEPKRRRALLGPEPYEAFTPRTITRAVDLEQELIAARRRGYALDDEEIDAGAVCAAAAIMGPDGRPVGAISVSAVAARFPDRDLTPIGLLVSGWAERLGRALQDGTSAASVR